MSACDETRAVSLGFNNLSVRVWEIGEQRQTLTNLNNARENEYRIDYDYKVGQKVLLRIEGILRNAEARWHKKPWLITSVHTLIIPSSLACSNRSRSENLGTYLSTYYGNSILSCWQFF